MKYKQERVTSNESRVLRIIDVNTNRAVEGVRVMEEVVRFVLEDKNLTNDLKLIRGRLRRTAKNIPHLKGRKISTDVGRKSYTRGEKNRGSLIDIFLANAKRVQEALRVLEEFSKLINPRQGKIYKNIRFKLYEIERGVYFTLVRKTRLDFDLYVVTDPARDHVKVAREAIKGGVKIIQLRDKTASKKQILKWAKQIRGLTQKAGMTFIVNDYIDIAEQVDADGVHLGQGDLKRTSIARARKRLGESKIIGASTHNLAQALKAQREGADYVAVGPIFSTPTKPGKKPVGVSLLKRVKKNIKVPIVAIGGIDKSNIQRIKNAGIEHAAVIRAVVCAKDIKAAATRLRKVLV